MINKKHAYTLRFESKKEFEIMLEYADAIGMNGREFILSAINQKMDEIEQLFHADETAYLISKRKEISK